MLVSMSEDTGARVAVAATEEVVIELDRTDHDGDIPDGRHPAADRALGRIAGAVFV